MAIPHVGRSLLNDAPPHLVRAPRMHHLHLQTFASRSSLTPRPMLTHSLPKATNVCQRRLLVSTCHARVLCNMASNSSNSTTPASAGLNDTVSGTTISILQDSDKNATVVELRFQANCGALRDTINALRDLGLGVVGGHLCNEASFMHTKIFITRLDTGCKVENAELLEEILATIVSKFSKSQEGIIITSMLATFLMGSLLLADLSLWRVYRQISVASLHAPSSFLASIMIPRTLTLTFLISAAIAGWLGSICIPLLKVLKADQIFREEGPASHFSKVGTPTMGGLLFVPTGVGFSIAVALILTGCISQELVGVATVTITFAAIGLLDDVLTLIHQHNYGLPGFLKFVLQVTVGVCFYFWLDSTFLLPAYQVKLPPPIGPLQIGKWYFPLTTFCFTAMSNGVNLTDGLDGLAGGTAAAAFVGMALAVLPCLPVLGLFGVSMAGACIGFLVHNCYKATIFMGDTGSLPLGGALAAMAACTGLFFPLFVISGVYVIETMSVVIQVFYFKLTKRVHGIGRRFFRMSPIHHHFEFLGVREPIIVAGAYVVACVMAFLGAYLGFVSNVKK